MALERLPGVSVPVVHAAAQAVLPLLAAGAAAAMGPAAVPEGLEARFPHFIEVVLIDVSLGEPVAVDVGTGADATVDEDGSDIDAGVTESAHGTDLFLVSAQVALATEGNLHGTTFFPLPLDELHQFHELRIRQVHVGIRRRPADGDDGEQPPLLQAHSHKQVVHLLQFADIPLVHTGNDISVQAGFPGEKVDGPEDAPVTARHPPHPVVRGFEAVQTERQDAHAGLEQPLLHGLVVKPAVGNHAPAETPAADLPSGLHDVRAEERFPACKHHGEILRPMRRRNRIQRPQEILQRHVLLPALHRAVAPAVAAMEMAARRTLPEQIVQFMHAGLVVTEKAEEKWVHTANIILFASQSCSFFRILCKKSVPAGFTGRE